MPQRERKKNYDVNEYYRDVLGQVCSFVGRASLICELYCGTMWFVRDEVALCLRLCSRWRHLWPSPKTTSPRPA